MHWTMLGCTLSSTMLCIESRYTTNFATLHCELCCTVLHCELYYTTLRSNSITLHYVWILLCCVASSATLRTLLHCIVLRFKLYCTMNSIATLLHCVKLWFCCVTLWTLLCCTTNFARLHVEFCCEFYYTSIFIDPNFNNLHTQKQQLTGEKLHTHENKRHKTPKTSQNFNTLKNMRASKKTLEELCQGTTLLTWKSVAMYLIFPILTLRTYT
jgi:hypothetical protein